MDYRILDDSSQQSSRPLSRKVLQWTANAATNATTPSLQPTASTSPTTARIGGAPGSAPMSSMRSQPPENLWGVVIIALSLVLVLSGIASCCTKLLRWRRQRVQEQERERHGARKDDEPLPGRLTTWAQLAPLNKSHRGVLRNPLKLDGSSHRKPQQPSPAPPKPAPQAAVQGPAAQQQQQCLASPAPPAMEQNPQRPPTLPEAQQLAAEDDILATPTVALPLPPDPPLSATTGPGDAATPSTMPPAAGAASPTCCHHEPGAPASLQSQPRPPQPQPQQPQERAASPQGGEADAAGTAVSEVTAAPLTEGPAGAAVDEQDSGLCSICLEDYCCSDVMRVLPCGHFFHQECVDTWMDTQAMVCPLCRTDLRVESPRKAPLRRRLRCPCCFRGARRAADSADPSASPAPAPVAASAARAGGATRAAAGPAAGAQAARRAAEDSPV